MFRKIVSTVYFMHKGHKTILAAGNECRKVSKVNDNITTVFFKLSFLLKSKYLEKSFRVVWFRHIPIALL